MSMLAAQAIVEHGLQSIALMFFFRFRLTPFLPCVTMHP